MTGSDIKHIRTSRGLTLRQMAALLRDASHTTVSRWEDAPDEPLPSWVAERLLGDLTITMSASTFATLLELAAQTGQTPEALFSEALANYAEGLRAATPDPFPSPPPALKIATPPPVRRLAEDDGSYNFKPAKP